LKQTDNINGLLACSSLKHETSFVIYKFVSQRKYTSTFDLLRIHITYICQRSHHDPG